MGNFIYVYNEAEKTTFESLGYELLKADETNSVYIFKNEPRKNYSLPDGCYVISNTLTF